MPLHYQQPRPGTLCFLLLSFHLSVAPSMPICWIQYIRNSLTGFIIIRRIYLDRLVRGPMTLWHILYFYFFFNQEFVLLIMTKWNVKNGQYRWNVIAFWRCCWTCLRSIYVLVPVSFCSNVQFLSIGRGHVLPVLTSLLLHHMIKVSITHRAQSALTRGPLCFVPKQLNCPKCFTLFTTIL